MTFAEVPGSRHDFIFSTFRTKGINIMFGIPKNDDKNKGEIGFNNDTIIVFGSDQKLHDAFRESYLKITIENQKEEVVKEVDINGTDNMLSIIEKYNLENGICYENGYIIELEMAESNRIHVKMNETNVFTSLGRANKTEIFKIIDDQLLSHEFYEEKYLKLLVEWRKNYKLWDEEVKNEMNGYINTLGVEGKRFWKRNIYYLTLLDKLHSLHQDMQIIQNSFED